jgi:hypothetical protein
MTTGVRRSGKMRREALARLGPPLVLLVSVGILVACAHLAADTPTVGVAPSPTTGPAAPPAAYDQVIAAYTEMEDWVLVRGGTISDLLIRDDAAALYRRFSPELRAELAQEQWDAFMAELTAIGAVGPRMGFRTLSAGGVQYYLATHAWGGGVLQVTAGFDAPGALAGIDLSPRELLPEDEAAEQPGRTSFRLPFDGLWYVAWGGLDELHNYHVTIPAQRYAYDFMVWVDGSTCRGRCDTNEDYYAFGQTILAPADGTVVAVVGDQPDRTPHTLIQATEPGNYVILDIGEGEYLFIAHMQQGSVQVEAGDWVQTGQPIGRVGNSGGASEPHLHIHLQNAEEFALEGPAGLPLLFSDYVSNGVPVEQGIPRGSQFVQHRP